MLQTFHKFLMWFCFNCIQIFMCIFALLFYAFSLQTERFGAVFFLLFSAAEVLTLRGCSFLICTSAGSDTFCGCWHLVWFRIFHFQRQIGLWIALLSFFVKTFWVVVNSFWLAAILSISRTNVCTVINWSQSFLSWRAYLIKYFSYVFAFKANLIWTLTSNFLKNRTLLNLDVCYKPLSPTWSPSHLQLNKAGLHICSFQLSVFIMMGRLAISTM